MKDRAALWLGIASAADYVAQMLLPALLVRSLAPEDFGGYRILWMVAQTGALVLSLNMAQNLVFMAPRHGREQRGALLCNVLVYLLLAGLMAGALATPLLGAIGASDARNVLPDWALPLFVGAWIASLPFDQIGLIAGRPAVQARLTLVQTALRLAVLGGAAWATRSIAGVAAAMVALALIRLALTLVYARRSGAFGPWRLDLGLGLQQWRTGVGFGLGSSLFMLRAQADGWIAAARFDAVAVATIFIAMAFVPLISVIRQSHTSATVAELARLFAAGDIPAALRLNQRANLATALLVFPLVGMFCAVAPDAIALVYTRTYVDAALPARLYALAYAVCVVEVGTVVQSLGDSRFTMVSGVVLLVIGAGVAWLGSGAFGLPGIALGSLAAMWLGAAWTLQHVSARCRVPLRELQPWRDLLALLVLAASASLTSGCLLAQVATGAPAQRIAIGGALFAVLYVGGAALFTSTRVLYAGLWLRRRRGGGAALPSQP